MSMDRRDYAFPFRIDGASQQAAQAPSYEAHVEQMIRQVLLTAPGERINMPDFGCGLRRLLFAPNSPALAASTQLLVLHSLQKWLGTVIDVKKVDVVGGTTPDASQLLVTVQYTLRETQAPKNLEVLVS